MEPLTNDDPVHDEETPAGEPATDGVVTGAAPYDTADDEDWED